MPYVLPVPPTTQMESRYRETAEEWEQAAPTDPNDPTLGHGGGPVTRYRTGPGDIPQPRDEWMGVGIRDIGHNGVENGRELFALIPGPPPEGHQGYDIPDTDLIIERSTSRQALFWSDWYESTAANAGGGGSFRGDHVVIARIPPGSTQGYMPSDPGMVQYNVDRNAPQPWDTNLTIGGGAGAAMSQ